MEPLGHRSDIVEINTLTKWNLTQLPEYRETQPLEKSLDVPFEWRNDLNAKVSLWDGDLTTLNVHAIVNPTNEAMNDPTGHSGRIFSKAGPGLQQDIRLHLKGCKTGAAQITEGHQLLSRYILHTVGPRYNIRYTTAAESALYSCYRNVLQLSRENGIETLALPCIHSLSRGYPPEDGAHIAIRTVRRFLEKYSSKFEMIVFVVNDPSTKEIYQDLFPLYFPRSKEEAERARRLLPADIGNEDGEPFIPERQIRIADKPTGDDLDRSPSLDNNDDRNDSDDHSDVIQRHSFTHMEGDVDISKRANVPVSNQREVQIMRRYQQLLQQSRITDLSSIAALRCLYQSGVDRMGRPVIIFIGRNLPPSEMDLEKVLLYFIQVLDPVVIKEYIIVYFHTLTLPSHRPDINFLRNIYEVVDQRYKKNLKSFYVVHPTIWSKVASWFFTTFSTSGIKQKVQNLAGIEHLYSRVNPDQLDIPDFILEYDMKVNGQRYYVPSDREVKEAMEGL